MNVAGYNDQVFSGRFQFGKAPKWPLELWMQKVNEFHRLYKRCPVPVESWKDPRWWSLYEGRVLPSEAYHEVIDGPEYEVDEEAEVHVDADVMEAQEIAGSV